MGSINKSHNETDGGILLFSGELILLYCDSVHCEVGGKESIKGRVYLTTHRLVVIITPYRQNAPVKSFCAPFCAITKCSVEQPIFGANYIEATVRDEADPSASFRFKLKFSKGGAIELAMAMNRAVAAVGSHMQSGMPPPPAYTPSPSAQYYQAPPTVYAPGYNTGFQMPVQQFPDTPPIGFIYASSTPAPYPGLGGNTPAPPPYSQSGGHQPAGSGGYPGQQQPTSGYPGGQQPGQYPQSGYPGGQQQPTGGYPGQQQPTSGYPGQQPPASGYPSSQQPPASGYPGGQQPPAGGYPDYPQQQPSSQQQPPNQTPHQQPPPQAPQEQQQQQASSGYPELNMGIPVNYRPQPPPDSDGAAGQGSGAWPSAPSYNPNWQDDKKSS